MGSKPQPISRLIADCMSMAEKFLGFVCMYLQRRAYVDYTVRRSFPGPERKLEIEF